jgi:hypothetical protein
MIVSLAGGAGRSFDVRGIADHVNAFITTKV